MSIKLTEMTQAVISNLRSRIEFTDRVQNCYHVKKLILSYMFCILLNILTL